MNLFKFENLRAIMKKLPILSAILLLSNAVVFAQPQVHSTNVLQNLVRFGDLPTNTFTESVLRPGDELTTYISVTNPGGGFVSLTPLTDGLSPNAYWTNVVSGATAKATFQFQPTINDMGDIAGDYGSNYTVALVSTVGGSAFTNYWSVYVPSLDEQQIYITEIFANPTTNRASPAFNPLQRGNPDINNVAVNDQYIELVNLSGGDMDLYNWTINNGTNLLHQFYNGGYPEGGSEELYGGGYPFVVYGGPTPDDNPPVNTFLADYGLIEPADPGPLGFSTNGGVISLHNGNGFLVDRLVYPAGSLNCSFSRFPSVNDVLVPQAYISTNYVTPGIQYNGDFWYSYIPTPTWAPVGIINSVMAAGNPMKLTFPIVDTSQTMTLWQANSLADKFTVTFGETFTNASGVFYITNPLPECQFYFVTGESNIVTGTGD
jgi:hypothetical protein